MGRCMMVISILLSFKGSSGDSAVSIAAIAFFFIVSTFCVVEIRMFLANVLPTVHVHARAKGTAITTACCWMMVSQLFSL